MKPDPFIAPPSPLPLTHKHPFFNSISQSSSKTTWTVKFQGISDPSQYTYDILPQSSVFLNFVPYFSTLAYTFKHKLHYRDSKPFLNLPIDSVLFLVTFSSFYLHFLNCLSCFSPLLYFTNTFLHCLKTPLSSH